MIDALTTGVANLDGQGLAAPAKGLVSKLQADVRGLRTDLKQVVGPFAAIPEHAFAERGFLR
jgi:hypothetical protein